MAILRPGRSDLETEKQLPANYYGERSILKEIAYLDPELDTNGGYLHLRTQPLLRWREIYQFACSPCVATLGVLIALLTVAANLPS